jgi:hypothetical protein
MRERSAERDIRAKVGSDAETLEKTRHILGNATVAISRKHYRRKPDIVRTDIAQHRKYGATLLDTASQVINLCRSGRGSNPRPPAWQAGTLDGLLTPKTSYLEACCYAIQHRERLRNASKRGELHRSNSADLAQSPQHWRCHWRRWGTLPSRGDRSAGQVLYYCVVTRLYVVIQCR